MAFPSSEQNGSVITPLPGDKVNITDPESRIMKGQKGFFKGYNGQILVDENQVVLTAQLTNEQTDHGQLELLFAQFIELLSSIGITQMPHDVLADAGYSNYESILSESRNGPCLLLATSKEYKIPESDTYDGALYQLDEICRIMGDFPPPPPIFGAVHQTNSRHMSKVSCSVRMEEEQRREKELFEFFHSHLNLAVTSLAFEHIFKPVSPFSRVLINTHI